MSCRDKIGGHALLLEGVTFKEAREFIEDNSDEVYYVPPGYKILDDCYLIGTPPIALGVKGLDLIFPVVRPRLGTFVLSAQSEKDIMQLRAMLTPRKKI
jgi:hypothetical protein